MVGQLIYRWKEVISFFGRMDRQPENIIPPAPKGGGIKKAKRSNIKKGTTLNASKFIRFYNNLYAVAKHRLRKSQAFCNALMLASKTILSNVKMIWRFYSFVHSKTTHECDNCWCGLEIIKKWMINSIKFKLSISELSSNVAKPNDMLSHKWKRNIKVCHLNSK